MANFDPKHLKILIFESKNRENSVEKHIYTSRDPKNQAKNRVEVKYEGSKASVAPYGTE